MRSWVRGTLFCLSVGSLLLSVCVGTGAEDPMHVLMIGNSYTRGVSGAFSALANATDRAIDVEYITPGGKTLLWHASSEKTRSRIKAKDWDVVVLQEQSQTPAYPNTRPGFVKGARLLQAIIAEGGARTVLFQTWGRRDGDKHNLHAAPDYTTMQNLLSDGYGEAAKALAVSTAPAGEAWRRVHGQDKALFARLYRGDGSHPSAAGGYLAACVLYRTILKESPPETDIPKGLGAQEAALLRKAARDGATAP